MERENSERDEKQWDNSYDWILCLTVKLGHDPRVFMAIWQLIDVLSLSSFDCQLSNQMLTFKWEFDRIGRQIDWLMFWFEWVDRQEKR